MSFVPLSDFQAFAKLCDSRLVELNNQVEESVADVGKLRGDSSAAVTGINEQHTRFEDAMQAKVVDIEAKANEVVRNTEEAFATIQQEFGIVDQGCKELVAQTEASFASWQEMQGNYQNLYHKTEITFLDLVKNV